MEKGKEKTKTRYYYVYSEEMFLHFFMKYEQITIIKIYNEVGNWILLFKKN